MPRPKNGNGNGNGNVPPDQPPPGSVPPEEPEDNDPQRQVIEFLRQIVAQGMDQYSAEINSKFEQQSAEVNAKFDLIAGQLAQVVEVMNQHTMALQGQGGGQVPPGNTGTVAAAAGAENQPPAKMDIGSAVSYALSHLGEIGEGLASMAVGYGKFKAASRPPDAVNTLMWLKQAHPELLSLFVPDPLGGKLPDLLTNAMIKGMQIRQTANGANVSPLVNPSAVSWDVAPSMPDVPAPSAVTAPMGNFTDAEIDAGIAHLMRLKVARSCA